MGNVIEVRKSEFRRVEVCQCPTAELSRQGHGHDPGVEVDHRRLAHRSSHRRHVEPISDPDGAHVADRHTGVVPTQPACLQLPPEGLDQVIRVDQERPPLGVHVRVDHRYSVGDDGDLLQHVLPCSTQPLSDGRWLSTWP